MVARKHRFSRHRNPEEFVDGAAPSAAPTPELLIIDGTCRVCGRLGNVAQKAAPNLQVSHDPPAHLRDAAARGVIYCSGGAAFVGSRAIVAYLQNRGRVLRIVAAALSAEPAFTIFDALYRAFARNHRRFDRWLSAKPHPRDRPGDD